MRMTPAWVCSLVLLLMPGDPPHDQPVARPRPHATTYGRGHARPLADANSGFPRAA